MKTSEKSTDVNQLVRSLSIEWKPLAEPGVTGVFVKVLRFDKETGRAPTILLKFDPGATYPAHNHPGGEEVFVIEGDISLGKDDLNVGDYLFTPPEWQACSSLEERLHPVGQRASRGRDLETLIKTGKTDHEDLCITINAP